MGFDFNPMHPPAIFDPLDLTKNQKNQRDAQSEADAQAMENSGGRPADIQWTDTYDPSTQSMQGGIDQKLSTIGTDTDALNQFKGEAMRSGPSNYARMAGNQQEQQAMNAEDLGARQVAGQGATARSQLAMRGGLTGGAAERLATEGQKNYLDMSQGVQNQKAQNLTQIGMNDEQNRISQLGQAQGMENAQAGLDLNKLGISGQAQQFDIGNAIKNQQSKNDFDLGRYQSKMQEYGDQQTAAGQIRAGKGGKK